MKRHLYGFIISLIILLPDLIYYVYPPLGSEIRVNENKILTIIENIGRMGCLFLPAYIGIKKETLTKIDIATLICMMLVVIMSTVIWILYVQGGRDHALLLKPYLGIPIPLATLPIIYFLLAAFFMRSILMTGFAILFGIGHFLITYNVWSFIRK